MVTGAGRGLGRAIAHALARRGLTVHVTDVDEAAARAVADELGGGAWASALDVSDADACRAIAGATPGLRVWVNNAGLLVTGPSWEQDDAARRRLFDINALGLINGTDAALAILRRGGHGRIINIISMAGLTPAPSQALYAATKHAALAYSLATQADLRLAGVRDVRISCVCPDGVWTAMLEPLAREPSAWPSWTGVMYPPEHIAEIAADLVERPRPVVTIPRWRGGLVRAFAAMPRLGFALLPLVERDARRKQRRWAERIERGQTPWTHVRYHGSTRA